MANQNSDARAGRVSKLKHLIIAFLVVGIILPILLCILLFIKVARLERELNELKNSEVAGQETEETTDDEPDELHGLGAAAVWNENMVARMTEPGKEDGEPDEGQKTKLYLTFDDGPSGKTPEILDILKKYDIKATFFVIGRTQPQFIPIYQRIVEEGHTLGMHSYSHKYREIYASDEAFWNDLNQLQDFLYETTEVWPRFYRFPGGSSNRVSKIDMRRLTEELVQQDIYYLDWNVSGGDATGQSLSAQQIADNVTQYVKRYDTAVVLLHDMNDKPATVEALPLIIEKFINDPQVEFLPVSDDMDLVQHLSMSMD